MYYLIIFCIIVLCKLHESKSEWDRESYNLPDSHVTRFLNTFAEVGEKCRISDKCIFKSVLDTGLCWGYEADCMPQLGYSDAHCPGDHKGWVASKSQQLKTFFKQADFGYIKQHLDTKITLCHPKTLDGSTLQCSQFLQFCRGSQLYLDLRDIALRKEPFRYKMDVLKEGQIGGNCQLDLKHLQAEAVHLSPLQSWGPEMQHFREVKTKISKDSNTCDVYIEKPTYIMKIDATVNMYHHFCDFFNLYATLHVNGSHRDMFSRDIQIIIWETYNYHSNFGDTWSAFTENPIWNLRTLQGKRVCFRQVLFPLLPRMIFGLYYNTPVVWGCQQSGLVHAFSKFVLHRLKIPKRSVSDDSSKIRVTLLSRDTPYRRILNEHQLVSKLSSQPDFLVRKVVFTHNTDFRQQLAIIQQTDILVGMHGAGLTHLLFLPDWAAVFELYNCGDEHCYADLARIRGVYYTTWVDESKLKAQDEGHHPDGGAHAKFTNYAFDADEFYRIVQSARKHVENHPVYRNTFSKPANPKTEL